MNKGIPMSKTFGGKRYEFYGSYGKSKSQAKSVAKGFRNGGDLARVVVIDGEPCVYVKRKR